MILAKEVTAHPSPPSSGKYRFYALSGTTYVMFSDGTPRALQEASTISVVTTTTNYTVTDEDVILGSGTSLITVALPNATTFGKELTIKNTSTQDLTIVGTSGQLIDNVANAILRGGKKQSVTLFSNGANWWII